jgi:geranylgeranyl pyrophosphate synthase
MPDPWPSSAQVHVAVRERLVDTLDAHGGLVAAVGRRTLATGHGVLSEQPHSLTSVIVPGACVAAGKRWQVALWPAVGAELMMASADLFDDVADADPESEMSESSGVLLTAAAGLLSLASAAVVRVVEDGIPPATAASLAGLLGGGFADAANGQALNLQPSPGQIDPLTAYRQSAAKSGPLGSLIARLGARTATDDPEIVQLLGDFGRRLAVRSQLLNDARDAAPDPERLKADVRAGARTVPLAFAGSGGAPGGLTEMELQAWEQRERGRIAGSGGLAAAHALAEAERLGAVRALDALERRGCPVEGLRQLI